MEKLSEQSELERRQKIEAIKDRSKDAKEVNLNQFPVTQAASEYLRSRGLKRDVFRASSYNPFQNLANLERILRIEAKKANRQLTRSEVIDNLPMYENVMWFLYHNANYYKVPTIDEEIEIAEIATHSVHLNKEGREGMKERVKELRMQKAEGRIYSKAKEAEKQKALEELKPEERELLERALEDINNPKKTKR